MTVSKLTDFLEQNDSRAFEIKPVIVKFNNYRKKRGDEVSISAGCKTHHRSEYKSGYFVSILRLSEVHFRLKEAGKKQRKHCRPFINKRRKSHKPISAQSESGLPYTSAGKSRQTRDAKRCIEHFVKERAGK